MPRESSARSGMILGSSLLGTPLAPQGEVRIYTAPVKAAAAAGPTNEKNPLSIAALCIVLVAMCFILGYAIQPGSFRFAKSSFADTPGEAVTPDAQAAAPVRPTAGQATDPTVTQQDATSSATPVNAEIDETPAAAPERQKRQSRRRRRWRRRKLTRVCVPHRRPMQFRRPRKTSGFIRSNGSRK